MPIRTKKTDSPSQDGARSGIALVGRASDNPSNDSRLPVHSEASIHKSPNRRDVPSRRLLPLVNAAGVHLRWITEEEGRELLRDRLAAAVVNPKGRIRCLRAVEEQTKPAGPRKPPLKLMPAQIAKPTRYSHDRDTEDNPRGCWTLKRISNAQRSLYSIVVDELAA